jgi:hypothetical protein
MRNPAAGAMKRMFSKYIPAHVSTTTVARQRRAAQTCNPTLVSMPPSRDWVRPPSQDASWKGQAAVVEITGTA